MSEFQKIIIEIDEAIRSSAKWGEDAHDHLLDRLRDIIQKYDGPH